MEKTDTRSVVKALSKGEQSAGILLEVAQCLNPILSQRQPLSKIELSLSSLAFKDKLFALKWMKIISASNIELAYAFMVEVGYARKALERKGVEAWIAKTLSLYDKEGLYPAVSVIKDISTFSRQYKQEAYTCYLHEVVSLLRPYVQGLSGRQLEIKESAMVFTDTKNLYLPRALMVYKDKEKNRSLYKAMACFLWAQIYYGTFKRNNFKDLSTQEKLDTYTQKEQAKKIFLHLENIRLLANIERDLPGLYREINTLTPLINPNNKTWRVVSKKLKQKGCGVKDTFEALSILLKLQITLPEVQYQGSLDLLLVEDEIIKRNKNLTNKIKDIVNKSRVSQKRLESLLNHLKKNKEQNTLETKEDNQETSDNEAGMGVEHAETIRELEKLIQALLEDVDDLFVSDLLGETLKNTDGLNDKKDNTRENTKGTTRKNILFDEWDYLRQAYRKEWCHLFIKEVDDKDHDFKLETLQKHPFLMQKIRRIFEMMRDQAQNEKKQTDGDEIDIDALVQMHTARRAGEELTERLYIKRQHNTRSVSVCVLVDMSGSTKGWINLAIRESLILFSEALQTLGDEYAIYGFTGLTRQRCEIYKIKAFDERNLKQSSARIGNIQAKDYTRMGVAIRFAGRELDKIESKHRLLMILSDGKPDDYDGYQGEYGIHDTRKALLEIQGRGIKPFSITIDKKAQVYLPRLFGLGQFAILDNVDHLPMKLSEVYQKLST